MWQLTACTTPCPLRCPPGGRCACPHPRRWWGGAGTSLPEPRTQRPQRWHQASGWRGRLRPATRRLLPHRPAAPCGTQHMGGRQLSAWARIPSPLTAASMGMWVPCAGCGRRGASGDRKTPAYSLGRVGCVAEARADHDGVRHPVKVDGGLLPCRVANHMRQGVSSACGSPAGGTGGTQGDALAPASVFVCCPRITCGGHGAHAQPRPPGRKTAGARGGQPSGEGRGGRQSVHRNAKQQTNIAPPMEGICRERFPLVK